jgi:hypothetical protein
MGWFSDIWAAVRSSWQDPVDQAWQEKIVPLEVDRLQTRFLTIDKEELKTSGQKALWDQIDKLFATRTPTKELTWNERFSVESKIGCLRSGADLREEIASRLRWAKADGVPQTDSLNTAYDILLKPTGATATTDEVLRDFLLEVLSAIHTHRRLKYITGKLQAMAARKILFLVFVVLFVIFFFLTVAVAPVLSPKNSASLQHVAFVPIANLEVARFEPHFTIYATAVFGLLGALFSRLLTTLQPRTPAGVDELYNAATFRYILLRGTIGILGALVVYFFLQSGLVKGSVFPDFEAPLGVKMLEGAGMWPTKLLLPSASLALLIMWSFIAGFSESLVPNILQSTEKQFGGRSVPPLSELPNVKAASCRGIRLRPSTSKSPLCTELRARAEAQPPVGLTSA